MGGWQSLCMAVIPYSHALRLILVEVGIFLTDVLNFNGLFLILLKQIFFKKNIECQELCFYIFVFLSF